MMIVGIDAATTTGICYGCLKSKPCLESHCFRERRSDTIEDLFGRALAFWAAFLRNNPVDVVAIELPIVGTYGETNQDTTNLARGLYAIFTGVAKMRQIRLLTVEVATWRKCFVGRGGLKRAEAKRESLRMCQLLGWHAPDDNAADAAGVWFWACGQLSSPLFGRVA